MLLNARGMVLRSYKGAEYLITIKMDLSGQQLRKPTSRLEQPDQTTNGITAFLSFG